MTLIKWCEKNNKEYILEEWDEMKNTEFSLPEVSYGSEKKMWWKCKKGHEWEASPNSRTSAKSGCPYCSGRMAYPGENDLKTKMPEIAKEWHPTKNGDLDPSHLTCHSNRKVWWLCPNNHSYESTINNRVYGRGCPFCSGYKTLEGFNDLKTWCLANNRQDLLNEWDYSKNIISPSSISPKNHKKFWWKCSLGHEWDATIGSRTTSRIGRKPSGCPYCSNPPKRILLGFNDLETWCKNNDREQILGEWDYEKNILTPQTVSFGSGKAVWWKCSKNHSWKVAINNRSTGKTNCPICSRGQSSFPEQAVAFYLSKIYTINQRYKIMNKEADVYIPDYKIAIEYDGLLWHLSSKQELIDENKTLTFLDAGLVVIRLKETNESMESISDGKQHIIKFPAKNGKYTTNEFEWAISELFNVIRQYTEKEDIPSIDVIRDENSIRSYYMNVLKTNSVAEVFPELAKEWDFEKNEGITPDVFSSKNGQKVWWKCSNGHSWMASIHSRSSGKLGCPFCAGQKNITGVNDFETWCKSQKSNLLSEWNYEKNEVSPNEIPKSYKNKVWWKCNLGHEWEATVYNRVNGTGCPVCNNGNNVNRGKTSFSKWCKDNNLEIDKEWDYSRNDISPDEVSYGSHRIVWWICEKGHTWQAQIKSRTYNHGCPYCSKTNKKAVLGVNDLKTWCQKNDKMYIIDEWNSERNGSITPESVTFGSHKRVAWKCKNGHEWEAVIKERTKVNGNMCPECKKMNSNNDIV